MNSTKTYTKWWWGWEPEKLENWLEQKEAEGWHLFNVVGQIWFQFTEAAPRKVRYCADYQSRVTPQYKEIFQDAGWELVYSSMGWYIWRMEYEGERPDIYTEVDSLLDRNKRLMIIVGIMVTSQFPLMVSLTNDAARYGYIEPGIIVLLGCFISFAGYCFYKLLESSRRLKNRKKSI